MIQTVIFDMDGVIVDTEPVHRYAYFQHFSELSIDVSEEMFTSFTGNSTRNVFQRVNTIFNLNLVKSGKVPVSPPIVYT